MRWGRPIGMWCGGSMGEFENPPDLVAFPRDESEIETVLSWAEAEGAAVVPFGGGTSVVGGVEPRLGERPVVSLDLRRLDRVLEVDADLAGGADPGGGDRAGAGGPAARARADPAPLPAVLRVLDPRRLDRDPRRRALRDAGDPHRRPGRVGAGDHPAGAWESRRLPGSGAGPSPDRMLIGSEGILGVIAEAWVRVRPRPQFKASAGVALRRLRAGGRGGPRDRPVRPPPRQLPPPRRRRGRLTGAGDGSSHLLILGFESADHPVDAADGPGAGDRPRPRRHPGRGPHLRRRATTRSGQLARARSC